MLSSLLLIAWGKERARLGVTTLTDKELEEMTIVNDPELLEIRRPKNFAFNGILTIILIGWLVLSSFVGQLGLPSWIEMPPLLLFLVGTCIALMINYPKLKDQSSRISANAGDAVQVVILVLLLASSWAYSKVLVWPMP